ncbi:MAG TPA: protein kinase [Vicinamibacterales bacterium]|jgi:serine/threonine protein kinase
MITNISHYEILTSIGEGGMGVVYRGVDTRLGRPVAVKLLRSDGAIDQESRKRFVHEARAASSLNHPHIITIYDIGQDHGVDFIAMEFVDGSSLAQVLSRSRLRIEDALKYAVQIADALAAAHAAGILHRDLKPANIMVSDKGSIKVLDFGLAKLTESVEFRPIDDPIAAITTDLEDDLQTAKGTILGTAAYMSPEQAEGKPADTRSDVFSFGAVLYEMVTNRRAFSGDSPVSTLAAVLTGEPPQPSKVVAGLSPDLEKTILRCLRKNPDRRWQSMADLKVALDDLREELESSTGTESAASAPSHRVRRAVWAGLAVIAAGVLMFGGWRMSRTDDDVASPPFLKRLTSDIAWTDYPAISLDGNFLAYASDRSGEGNLDIYVQPINDGAASRLTRNAADDLEPSISPDGSTVVFRSNRQGGGVYLMSTLGGEERLVAARGYSPRFSPDGQWIAYGVTEQGGARIYVAPAAGGPSTAVAAGFYRAQSHVWSPDGRYLLFWAQRHRDAPPENNIDWYIAAVPGGSPVATEARRRLLPEGFEAVHGLPYPDAWVNDGNRILFHGHVGDSSNIWQVPMTPGTWRVSGTPRRVTFGTTDEAAASVTSDGRMVFISRTMGADIWSVPLDANQGKPTGPLRRLTQDAAEDYDPTLSTDGLTLLFRSRRSGRFGVVLKKLETGAETVLTRVPEDHYAALSPDGTKVAYSFRQNGKMPIFVVAASGGTRDLVCDDCGQVESWSADGSQILYLTAHDPSGVGIVKSGSSRNDEWLRHPDYGIYNARVSSDGWVAFNGRADRLAPAQIFIARLHASAAAVEKVWIPVSRDGEAPNWSPDAAILYFWSDRDGSPCLWAQRLDPSTKRPAGGPLAIQHFHGKGLSSTNLYLGAPEIAVARDKIVFNLGEHTGNIWMTRIPK